MGQKVNPISFRLQVNKEWNSRWYMPKRKFADRLQKDLQARKFIKDKFGFHGAINRIKIEQRSHDRVTVAIYTARVGVIIGRGGQGTKDIIAGLRKIYNMSVKVNVEEIKRPEVFAQLVAENIARQVERRMSYKRAMKTAATEAIRSGAEGVRIELAGRLGGSEMSRREREIRGSVPLHRFDSMIDYGSARARYPMAGIIGIKVWVNRGEVTKRSGVV